MSDNLTPDQRRGTMRRVKGRNTSLELALRRMLRRLGYVGYRLHRRELPGVPDVAFLGRKRAIFAHGCFWHSHDCPAGWNRPASRTEYWLPKLEGNRQRDARHRAALEALGWRVLVVWECEWKDPAALESRLRQFMEEEEA